MEKRDLDIILNTPVNWRMYYGKTILVTGATGRLGRYIVETLIEVDLRYNLDLRVIGLARSKDKVKDVFKNLMDFPNLSFFGKYVKRYLGVSPKQYREQLSSDTSSKISD